jgi:hypothetical protein
MYRKLFAAFAIAALAFTGATATLADGLNRSGRVAASDTPTYVAPPFAWSGVYIGAGLGWGHALGDTTFSHEGEDQLSVKSFGGDGWRIPIIGGFDYHFRGTPIVIGAFGTWNPDGWGDTEFSLSDNNGQIANANLALTYSAGVRLGLVMANQSMIYAGYKHQWADLTLNAGSFSETRGIRGHGVVGGIEMPLSLTGSPIQATFALEGGYTRFEKTTFDLGCPEVDVRPDDLSVMAFLKIRTGVFGGN